MKKKGNKKMPRPSQEIIDNPIPTSLFMCYAVVLLFVGTGDAILRTLVFCTGNFIEKQIIM